MIQAGLTYLNRVRVRSRHRDLRTDSIAARLGVERLLSQTDFHPSGWPPHAVLLVRRLSEPVPSLVADAEAELRQGQAWEQAVRDQLAAMVRRAARPVRGEIRQDADAVVFEDQAEMLACLTLALGRHEAWSHWWCVALFRSLPDWATQLPALVLTQARELPAVFHYLCAWGVARHVFNALESGQVDSIVRQLAHAHDLPVEFVRLGNVLPSRSAEDEKSGAESSSPSETGSVEGPPIPTPWNGAVQTIVAAQGNLRRIETALLGLCLSLHFRPSVVKSRGFAHRFQQWLRTEETGFGENLGARHAAPTLRDDTYMQGAGHRLASFGAESPNKAGAGSSGLDTNSTPEPTAPLRSGEHGHALQARASIPTNCEMKPQPATAAAAAADDAPTHVPEGRGVAQPAQDKTQLGVSRLMLERNGSPSFKAQLRSSQAQRGVGESSPAAISRPPEAVHVLEPVTTELGGTFYLINVMRQLGLPGCFEERCLLATRVGVWGVLELLARGLSRPSQAPVPDPVWAALARLDGRHPHELPDGSLGPLEEFRLPSSWLAWEPELLGRPCWAEDGEQLWIGSQTGFVVVLCRRTHEAAPKQVARELDAYGIGAFPATCQPADLAVMPIATLGPTIPDQLNESLRRWLELVLPFLTLRLRRALEAQSDAELFRSLLMYPARLFITSTHVDVVMRLNDISLPVRRAGLDCNPGWCPDFGRVIQFHFE